MLLALVALGYRVDLVTVPSDAPWRVPGVTVHTVPRLWFRMTYALMLFKAVFLAGRSRYDIIHGVDGCGVVARMAGALVQRPCVYDVQEGPAGALGRWALRRADVVIGENADAVARLAQWGRGARACVIPNIPALTGSVPAPVLNLARARYGGGVGNQVVTCVGSYRHLRGITMFINSVPYVLGEDAGVRFVVAGGTAEQIAQMRGALEEAGIAGAVTFTGRLSQEEMTALLMVSDILVAPHQPGATVPIRVLDYLHMLKPIVVVNTGFSRTVFSGHNAMVVEADHEALAEGILNLCRHPGLAESLAQKGHETLLVQNRTPEAFREALRQCYDYGSRNEV